MSVRKRQPGRPTKLAKEGEKTTLSLRVTPELKRQLDDAGASGGRNLSQEAELRLRNSLQAERVLDEAVDLVFPADASIVAIPLLRLLAAVGPQAGYFSTLTPAGARDWFDNPYAYDQVVKGIAALLEALRPPGATAFPFMMERGGAVQECLGQDFAAEILRALLDDSLASDDQLTRVRQKLSAERRQHVASRLP
jgi:hypothetical protein